MLNLNFQNGQAPALNARNMNAIVESINTLGYAVGGPNVASTVSAMTDTSKVYVYTGSETGYTAGNWYYYNGSAWVSGGVYQATAVETDTTLTMPGEPADAKVTGEKVADLKNALTTLRTEVLTYDLIPNEYVNAYGIHKYDGWSRTPRLICKDIKYLKINTPVTVSSTGTNYSCFYDIDDNYIGGFNALDEGDNCIYVPDTAYYMILSQETNIITNYKITCMLVSSTSITNTKDVLDGTINLSGLSDRLKLKILSNNLTHRDLAEEDINANYRFASPIFKMADGSANPINLRITNSKYSMKICAFYKKNDEYILQWKSEHFHTTYRLAPYIRTINGEIVAMDYFAVVFSDAVRNRYLNEEDRLAISESFSAYEEPSPNKYYRVCTFNMARRWGCFRSKSDESYSKWQIAQYLNLFGEIDPDVLCMQEALGVTVNYIDTAQKYHLQSTVLDHKFGFASYFDDTRFASKYIFDNYANHIYQTQTEGSHKQYTKCNVNMDGYRVCVFNTHTAYLGEFEEYLKPQIEELITAMQNAITNGECDYVIACGDFNSWDPSQFDLFTNAGFKIANCGSFGNKTTWAFENYNDSGDLITNPDDPTGPKIPKHWNMNCLDNIIVSSNINIQNVGVVELYESNTDQGNDWPLWKDNKPYAISDHFPLYADISFT